VGNNPVNHIDPTGHCIEDLCIGEAVFVAAVVVPAVEEYGPEVVAEGEQLLEEVGPLLEEGGTMLYRGALAAGNQLSDWAARKSDMGGLSLFDDVGTVFDKLPRSTEALMVSAEDINASGVLKVTFDGGDHWSVTPVAEGMSRWISEG
jgi:hypothetical protein